MWILFLKNFYLEDIFHQEDILEDHLELFLTEHGHVASLSGIQQWRPTGWTILSCEKLPVLSQKESSFLFVDTR